MRKRPYNLARVRPVNGRAFALRAALLALLALLLAALAATNLAARRSQDRLDRAAAGPGERQRAEMDIETPRLRQEIAARKKSLGPELAAANSLITRKSFSFVARLDFLEAVSNPGVHVRQLSLANQAGGRVVMSIDTSTLKEMFALYKKLAPYELVISREIQTQGQYLVDLSFKAPNEKL
jgi:hypothetical protein